MGRRLVGVGVVGLVVLFCVARIAAPHGGPEIAGGFSDAPFGPFAGYLWIGSVRSVSASITVPTIADRSALSEAGSWIGVQGQGPPARFVQVGVIESRFWSNRIHRAVDVYGTFWSDTAHHFRAQPLFVVGAGDTLSADLTLANKRWTLAIADDTSHKKARFSIQDETNAPFNQVEWTQEDPGTEYDHARYPQMASPVFRDLTVNSVEPPRVALYANWMSVNHSNLAPTRLDDDSFTLERASAVSVAAAQYLRLFAVAGAAFERFETERANWNVKTPYQQIAAASSRYITAMQRGIRSLAAARWSKQIRNLVRSVGHMTHIVLERAKPPTRLTASSFASWNSKLTEADERALPAAAKLRLVLGLPAFGPSYHR